MNTSDKKKLLSLFAKLYPGARSELNFSNDYQLIVAVILSAQCTDKKVNEVTPKLFERCGSFEALCRVKLETLEAIIRPVNYYKTKAKNLKAMACMVVSDFSGQLPATHEELRLLPGVGQKTANVIQCEQGEIPALPVDTHVFRVAQRLGLAHGKTPEAIEEGLKGEFASKHWRNLHHYLIWHGRRVCKAQRPLCAECGVATLCPSRDLFLK